MATLKDHVAGNLAWWCQKRVAKQYVQKQMHPFSPLTIQELTVVSYMTTQKAAESFVS